MALRKLLILGEKMATNVRATYSLDGGGNGNTGGWTTSQFCALTFTSGEGNLYSQEQ